MVCTRYLTLLAFSLIPPPAITDRPKSNGDDLKFKDSFAAGQLTGVGVKAMTGQFLKMLNAMLLDPSSQLGFKDVQLLEQETSSAQPSFHTDPSWMTEGEEETLFEESDR